ncbi:MAG: 6-pyruvoyl tetrahydropterin synthase [Gammaproteobacteria bacterium]|jgi:6-pyruvoyltetrahydropterin/6-carboxytetrahydropterin synthase|nr:6-pyruvoyl tetrahydropterin synthase [Gammaproteobacteria bacterium]
MTSLYFSAARSFEAARRTDSGCHGHGFLARLVADSKAVDGDFPGDECNALEKRLGQAVAPLDYALVNDHLPRIEDDGMAAWLLDRLGLSAAAALSLRSAPDRGAIVKHGGERLAWRNFRFESAHQLPNVPAGHKCGRMHGHGFQATIFSLAGGNDKASVVQAAIARAWQPLHERLHLACLNDLPGLENPTSEVLARWIWHRLESALPGRAGVSVMETASAGCHFDGSRFRIWKSACFDSAVRLAQAPPADPRRLVHGHTFNARLHLSGELDRLLGWVHDYGDVKRLFDPLFRELDHQPLHEHTGLDDNDAPSLARYIVARMSTRLPGLSRVDIESTPGCGATVLCGDEPRGLLVP